MQFLSVRVKHALRRSNDCGILVLQSRINLTCLSSDSTNAGSFPRRPAHQPISPSPAGTLGAGHGRPGRSAAQKKNCAPICACVCLVLADLPLRLSTTFRPPTSVTSLDDARQPHRRTRLGRSTREPRPSILPSPTPTLARTYELWTTSSIRTSGSIER